MTKIHLFTVFSLGFLCLSCEKVTDMIPTTVDHKLGSMVSTQIETNTFSYPIVDSSQNPELYAHLNRIKNHILSSPDIQFSKTFPWKLKIIHDDSTLNAFCVSGGYIYVYTGLINYLDNEGELAGVMAHEIAHADQRHGTKQLIKNYSLSMVLSMALGGDASWIVDLGSNLASLSFSRSDEQDADEHAVKYLCTTEYDPRSVGGFFKKLISEKKDQNIPVFLSTHPSSDNRIQEIENTWKKLGSKKGETFHDRYTEIKRYNKHIKNNDHSHLFR